INFSKRRKVAEITGEIQQYQNQPYCLTVQPEIRHFLESLNPLGDLDEKTLMDDLYNKSLDIEPRNAKQLIKYPRKWPDLTLKSPGIKPRGSRANHLPALQSLDSLLNSLSISQNEDSIADDSQTHSPSTPQTPPYSATSCGAGSDHSVFASVFIGGGGSTYGGPSPTTPIHSTPPTPNPWSTTMPGLPTCLPPNPSTPPPLPPRTNRGATRHNSMSYSSDMPSPRSRFAPSFAPTFGTIMSGNAMDDPSNPPPLPPRCATFSSATLPRNLQYNHNNNHSSHSPVASAAIAAQHNIQRFSAEFARRNSAMDLSPSEQPLLSRRYSQSGHHGVPLSPTPLPPLPTGVPNSTATAFPLGPVGPCPQLPPKTYRQTLNNIAR
ncbi:unnamed protein product, partial [Medioppia subpectinata]